MTDLDELKAAARAADAFDHDFTEDEHHFVVSTETMWGLMRWWEQTDAVLALIERLEVAERVVEAAERRNGVCVWSDVSTGEHFPHTCNLSPEICEALAVYDALGGRQ